MITCPLCEHQQAVGHECEVCGRPFPESVVRSTGHPDLPVEPVPGLETTRVADPVPDATPPPASDAPCVWCGHVQAAGALCERCGMRRHRILESAPAAEGPDEEGLLLCSECGVKTPPPVCRNCGIRVVSD